jgi:hypothetical protein
VVWGLSVRGWKERTHVKEYTEQVKWFGRLNIARMALMRSFPKAYGKLAGQHIHRPACVHNFI